MKNLPPIRVAAICLLGMALAQAQVPANLQTQLDQQASSLEPQLITWRRYFHQYPELSNQEVKTSAYIVAHLKKLGLEVQHPVAKTGIVALLKGGKPGPVVALRADMDGLPITERNSLPFLSKERATLAGQESGVMHACGHDAHMAILMTVAEVLTRHKSALRGTVKFIFQPAEEGVPAEEAPAGAELMVKEGVLANPKVDVIFGLHIQSLMPSGQLSYRPGSLMAAVDGLAIKIMGLGAHGATPWDSVDPIVVASQVVSGLQTVVSRQAELTKGAAVVTIGSIHGGNRGNIIPEEVNMVGTIRSFDEDMRKDIHRRIGQTASRIAESAGARADVNIQIMYPVTYNDPALADRMGPSLARTAGSDRTKVISPVTMAEDFSFFQQQVPGFFFFLGAYPAELPLAKPPTHHTADFMIDEKALLTGVRALVNLTVDYMYQKN